MCGQTKPLSDYYLKKRRNGDRKPMPSCKECWKAVVYAKRTATEWRDYMRTYREDPDARERQRASGRASYWRHHAKRRAGADATNARYPEKVTARELLKQAVRRGDITPEPCLFCDDPDSHAHHHDYTKPLEVTWLCRYHHGLAHREVSQP